MGIPPMMCNNLFEPKRELCPPAKTKPDAGALFKLIMVSHSDHTAAKIARNALPHRLHQFLLQIALDHLDN
jgi:hypothetical protein